MLARLDVSGFRNLASGSYPLGRGSQLLLGGNGAGKTSLLEAIYLVATTKSFRTSRLGDCLQHGASAFELQGETSGQVRRTLRLGFGSAGRHRSVNGRETSLSEHLEGLAVVAWTAEEPETLTGEPALRRRLMDRGVVTLQPAALGALGRYRDALAAKRQLLLQRAPATDFTPWHEVLAHAGSELAQLRAGFASALAVQLRGVLAELAFPLAAISLQYRPSLPTALDGAASLFEAFEAHLGGELRRGAPLVGLQRDDLEILWAGHAVRQVASAGERKALSLALTAAQGRLLTRAGRDPVYLLDDLDAELARGVLHAVWPLFQGAEQVIASSNRPEVWQGLPLDATWHVEGGVARTPWAPETSP